MPITSSLSSLSIEANYVDGEEVEVDPALLKSATEEAITKHLAFLVLCDRLLLRENCDEEIAIKVKDNILKCRDALNAKHLRSAAGLPSGHAVRTLFAEATVKDFVLARKRREPFKFEMELKEVEGYAADLLLACGRTFGSTYVRTMWRPRRSYPATEDPFTHNHFFITDTEGSAQYGQF